MAWLGRRNPPLWHSVQEPARGNRQPVAHLCEPQSLWAFIAGAGLHIGLMGADFPDFSREWLARSGAFLSIAAFGWVMLFVFAVFGPVWIAGFALHWGKSVASLVGAWIAASAAGVFSGKSDKTSGVPGESHARWRRP